VGVENVRDNSGRLTSGKQMSDWQENRFRTDTEFRSRPPIWSYTSSYLI